MPALTPYGLREWLTVLIVALALTGLCMYFGWWWATIPVAVVALALLAFFRDPVRRIDPNLEPGELLSPADGTVSAIETVDEHEATGGPAVIVRIFLSVLDVHINRSPCDGVVVSRTHRPGKYLDARSPESAQVNESLLLVLQPDEPLAGGERIGVRQVSGAVARRIVCPVREGDRLKRGERYGMIKFGSTTELILPHPADAHIHVCIGDKVKGGLTVLAELPVHTRSQTTPQHAAATAE